jgi:hypothetical protein
MIYLLFLFIGLAWKFEVQKNNLEAENQRLGEELVRVRGYR